MGVDHPHRIQFYRILSNCFLVSTKMTTTTTIGKKTQRTATGIAMEYDCPISNAKNSTIFDLFRWYFRHLSFDVWIIWKKWNNNKNSEIDLKKNSKNLCKNMEILLQRLTVIRRAHVGVHSFVIYFTPEIGNYNDLHFYGFAWFGESKCCNITVKSEFAIIT